MPNPVNRPPHYLERNLINLIRNRDIEASLKVIEQMSNNDGNDPKGPSFSWHDENDESFLLQALKREAKEVAEELVKRQPKNAYLLFSADVITKKTTLHYAVTRGYESVGAAIMKLSLEQTPGFLGHAYWLQRCSATLTPLHNAVLMGRQQVRNLLSFHQDANTLLNHVNVIDKDGNTPLHNSTNVYIALELIQHGANLELLNRERAHPLQHMTESNIALLNAEGVFRHRPLAPEIREMISELSPKPSARAQNNLFAVETSPNPLITNYYPSEPLQFQKIYDEFRFVEALKARLLANKEVLQRMPEHQFSLSGAIKWTPTIIVTLGVYFYVSYRAVHFLNSRMDSRDFGKDDSIDDEPPDPVNMLFLTFILCWLSLGSCLSYKILTNGYHGIIHKTTGRDVLATNAKVTRESVFNKIEYHPVLKSTGKKLKIILNKLETSCNLNYHRSLIDRAIQCLNELQEKLICEGIVLGMPALSSLEENTDVNGSDLTDDIEMQLPRRDDQTVQDLEVISLSETSPLIRNRIGPRYS